jgi:IS30 family transposase
VRKDRDGGTGGKSRIATLEGFQTRFVMLAGNPCDRTAERMAYLLARKTEILPGFRKSSLAWDQGPD